MSPGDYFAAFASFINLCACVSYAYFSRDYARAAYWFGAFILTGSTIFVGRK